MRIGILSQKLENNYGGILQNYALQQILIRLGHKPMTIDFRPGDSYIVYIVSVFKTIILNFLRGRKPHVEAYSIYKTNRSPLTTRFINEHIITTHRIQFLHPLLPYYYRFKVVIVGSDQVWRADYNVLRNTFLAFVKGKIIKLAYAASYGLSEWSIDPNQTKKCQKWIKDFRAISVRENSGVFLSKKYLNVNAIHVLDPTMLLEKKDYMQLCRSIPVRTSEYLFAYVLDITEEKIKIIEKIAQTKGLAVKLLSAEKNISSSIEDWLSHFRDASYIITDSFHGSVFSIIFRKPFNVLVNNSRGADRFMSLFSTFDLLDRIINIENNPNMGNIDWTYISEKLDAQKQISLDFLKNNLK